MPSAPRPTAAPRAVALVAGLVLALIVALAAVPGTQALGATTASATAKKKQAAEQRRAAKKRQAAKRTTAACSRTVATPKARRGVRLTRAQKRAAARRAARLGAKRCAGIPATVAKAPVAAKAPTSAAAPVAKPASAPPFAAPPVAPPASQGPTPPPATTPATPAPPTGPALPVVRGGQDPAASRSITLGANVRGWRDGGAITSRFAEAKADGTRTTRVDFWWGDTEPQPGRFEFAAYDARFRALAGQGMRALVMLDGTAPWAGDEADYSADPAGFARFTARVVGRYGAGGSFWTENPQLDPSLAPVWFELWNEPYLPASAAGRRSPAAYARLVKSAVIAGRAANPNVKFTAAAETVVYDDVQGRWRDWITALFQEVPDLGANVDGWSMHPYFAGDPSDYSPGTSGIHRQFLRLDAMRDQLRRAGVGAQPWFVSEIGSATCRDLASNYSCTTADKQASNFRETLQYLRTRYADNVRAVLTYRNEDLDYGSRGGDYDALGSFGMRRVDGTAKPVLAAFQAAFTA